VKERLAFIQKKTDKPRTRIRKTSWDWNYSQVLEICTGQEGLVNVPKDWWQKGSGGWAETHGGVTHWPWCGQPGGNKKRKCGKLVKKKPIVVRTAHEGQKR